MHDFMSKIYVDLTTLKHELSNMELKKLVANFERGVETINLICIKIWAKQQVAKNLNREMHIGPNERESISAEIHGLTNALNKIVETDPMKKFLGEHPGLAERAYMKLEAEGVNDFYEPDKRSEEEKQGEFLGWIESVQWYTGALLFELDEVIKTSF